MFEKLSAYAKNIPYQVFSQSLYTRETLLNDFDASDPNSKDRTYDRLTYRHFVEKGKVVAEPLELMTRALHDQSMAAAVDHFLRNWNTHRIVGVMGGHALARTDITYRKIVLLSNDNDLTVAQLNA